MPTRRLTTGCSGQSATRPAAEPESYAHISNDPNTVIPLIVLFAWKSKESCVLDIRLDRILDN